ncbi:TetR/AcrR family transcriptional regulator [Nocardia goodfellowii]|uniref:AcrR family transcriptional regulator n=1 Tax=Nocardia goodfellowii TaxID=882446 RepID=A0ABS4QL61_9NOCA|nr:TetR/AcrR family transcriptional regulator [Nocardia goodfellowii]MBP2192430.1 AcrR family transcriptional regulator [Nocardia goodfellowii]
MPDLPEHSSPKAARILAAAGDLLLSVGSKGMTIADVARKAHVGKGTVYLYWKSKEDLLLGVVGRDYIAVADEIIAAVSADPDLARPSRLCPFLLRVMAGHPYANALMARDEELLGVIAADPAITRLFDTLGPDAMMHDVLPMWRADGMARTDWSAADQAFALQALTTGFLATAADRSTRSLAVDPETVFAAAVTALLGPDAATAEQVRSTAEKGLRSLAERRADVWNHISPA